jgi:hypothetical protein
VAGTSHGGSPQGGENEEELVGVPICSLLMMERQRGGVAARGWTATT